MADAFGPRALWARAARSTSSCPCGRAPWVRRVRWPNSPVPDCLVLVVDDDETIRTTVSETLDLEGYPVHLAADGVEALRSAEESPPQVILLDMRMPVLDGWGVARGLAERGLAPNI